MEMGKVSGSRRMSVSNTVLLGLVLNAKICGSLETYVDVCVVVSCAIPLVSVATGSDVSCAFFTYSFFGVGCGLSVDLGSLTSPPVQIGVVGA